MFEGKKIKMLFSSLDLSVLGKTLPKVLSNAVNWCHELKDFAKRFYYAASSPIPCCFLFPSPFSVSILFFK